MWVGTLRSAAGTEISKVAAVARLSANFIFNIPTFFTAVLAATGRNRPKCGPSAVAGGVSYCCRSAIQDIGVRGDEHSSGRQGVSANWRGFSVAGTTLYITPQAADLSVPTHTCRCYRVFSCDFMPENSYPTKADLS